MQQSRSIYNSLPQSQQGRQNLKKQIFQFIQRLHQSIQEQKKNENVKQIERLSEKVQTLTKRLKLIDKCQQFSLLRLNHLEQIFKYYCTHIFKIGKHMTFDRLQYEKQHLTIERLFLFLKDFQLNTMIVDGKQKEVLNKNAIITIFKKTSSNARDLSFQEFIKCIQKIAIAFYDDKQNYYVKIEQQKLQKIRRKKQFQKKKVKRMKLNGQKVDQKHLQEIEKLEQQQKIIDQQIQKQDKQENQKNLQPQQFNNQNDDLIKQMMQNKDLQDPNDEVNKITNQTKDEIQKIQIKKNLQKEHQAKLLKFTTNQKIQFFYELINVDSLSDYKNKLTKLNMTVFQKKQNQKENQKVSEEKPSIEHSMSLDQNQRINKLKQKMNQKKQKQKAVPIPKPKQQKQTQTARKRRQMKQQRQLRMKQKKLQSDQLLQKKKDAQKKNVNIKAPTTGSQQNSGATIKRSQFNQKQVNWNMLQKMNFQQLKLRQFNPTKLYSMDQDDNIFMQQYGGGYMRNNRQKRANSRLQVRQRQSLSVVQNVRKRVDQIQKVQKSQQNKLNKKLGSVKGKF